MTHRLTPKQEKFCQEYIVDLNATQAAIRAGYSPKTAPVIGAENLKKPNVAERLKELQQKVQERTEITQDAVLRELSILAFGRITDMARVNGNGHLVLDFTDATPEQKALIVGIKTKSRQEKDGEDFLTVVETEVKAADKLKAIELLGKHLGMFKEQVEITGKEGGPIQTHELSGLTDSERAARAAALLDSARARRVRSAPDDAPGDVQ